jgi:serine/threonine-protein kinase
VTAAQLLESDPAHELSGDRTSLQRRLATYGLTVLAIAVGYWPAFYLVWSGYPGLAPGRIVAHVFSPYTFALLGLHAGLWWLARGRVVPTAWLVRLDVVYHALVGVVFGGIVAGHPVPAIAILEGLLALTCVLSVRALIVPSSGARTALVGLLLSLGPALTLVRDPEHFATSWLGLRTSGALFANWTLIAIAISSVASWVLYGLRREVRDARRLGQYTLVERIGEGGMGVVYRAEHSLLKRPTAIKLLPSSKRLGSLERFEREVQLMAQLTHPNTVAVYDYGRTADGVFYYAMECLDGIDLDGLVAVAGPQPAARVIHLLRQICGSLDEAHRRGMVHRDIKPANVFLCRGRSEPDTIKVLDFGLVKDLNDAEPSLSADDSVLGTPLYVAPEQLVRKGEVGPASDIYSLAALGYFLLTATPVFPGKNVIEVCVRHLGEPPEPPSQRLGAPVPPDLERVILACLAKAASARPASARALRAALDACTDARGWTEAHAEAWWQEHATELSARQRARQTQVSPGRHSVLIDFARGPIR